MCVGGGVTTHHYVFSAKSMPQFAPEISPGEMQWLHAALHKQLRFIIQSPGVHEEMALEVH